MLIKVLREIQRLSTFSATKLAKSLGIDEDVIKQILVQLQAMGYIKEETINRSCIENCKSCGKVCSGRPIKILTITEKGNLILSKSG